MSDDLTRISGLRPSCSKALDGVNISSFVDLAQADRRNVQAALRRKRPVPTLETISRWQDDARDLAGQEALQSLWEQTAAFVVSFDRRTSDDVLRISVEQAETTSDPPRREWLGWDCEPLCEWIRSVLDLPIAMGTGSRASDPVPERALSQPPGEASPGDPGSTETSGGRPRLEVTHLTVLSATGVARSVALPVGDDEPPIDCEPGSKISLRVRGAAAGATLGVSVRSRARDGTGRRLLGPDPIEADGDATFDLGGVRPGDHRAVLAIWADDGSVEPLVAPLPLLRAAQRR